MKPARAARRRSSSCWRKTRELLTREPTGVGLDVPAWLVALEEEVDDVLRPIHERRRDEDLATLIPATMLTLRQARKQLKEWTSRQK